MIGGSALGARALSDAARRDLASAWGGPEPAAVKTRLPVRRESGRRMTVRRP